MPRVLGARVAVALALGCALAGGCSLLLDFSEPRQHAAGGAAGAGGGQGGAGGATSPIVTAFDLDDCTLSQPSPLSSQACDYRTSAVGPPTARDLVQRAISIPASFLRRTRWSPESRPSASEPWILTAEIRDCAVVATPKRRSDAWRWIRVDAGELAVKGESVTLAPASRSTTPPMTRSPSDGSAFRRGPAAGAPAIYIATVPTSAPRWAVVPDDPGAAGREAQVSSKSRDSSRRDDVEALRRSPRRADRRQFTPVQNARHRVRTT
jgi:hypothetical protein